MAAFSNDVAEKVLRVLQSANRLDTQKLAEVRKAGASGNGDILEKMIRGRAIDEGLVHQVLSKAYALRRVALAPADLDQRALKSVPLRLIDDNRAIPFAIDQRFLRVGIVDPNSASLAGQFKAASNLNIEFQLITLSNFEALRRDQRVKSAIEAPPPKSRRNRRHVRARNRAAHASRWTMRSWSRNSATISCTRRCSRARATSISNLSATSRGSASGSMGGWTCARNIRTICCATIWVLSRFKIMADCDISEKRLPQDGGITIKYKNEDIDFRFNVLPGKNGERIVMRILKGDPSLSLTKLGFSDVNYNNIIEAITAPQGMVLVTGPTGSGKTTTLYGCLQHINEPELNIMTAEDPVEYYLEGVGQTQANEKIGLTFNSILRAFLRQDPEVILVGEIRDQETVEIAVKAALTGHLLLSTLHTNDAIATITRLMNMGVPPFMIAAATSLIVAQRLGRPNCQNCLVEDTQATPDALRRLGFSEEESQTVRPMVGEGCDVCGGSGYKGRRGVYEVLRITPALEEAILKESLAPELLAAAKQDGFETMQEIARGFIKDGIFSIAEYTRILVL